MRELSLHKHILLLCPQTTTDSWFNPQTTISFSFILKLWSLFHPSIKSTVSTMDMRQSNRMSDAFLSHLLYLKEESWRRKRKTSGVSLSRSEFKQGHISNSQNQTNRPSLTESLNRKCIWFRKWLWNWISRYFDYAKSTITWLANVKYFLHKSSIFSVKKEFLDV